jgi:hypothetical protein
MILATCDANGKLALKVTVQSSLVLSLSWRATGLDDASDMHENNTRNE